MPPSDSYQWIRTCKLAAIAGAILLCLLAGAWLASGDLRWFCSTAAAGLALSVTFALAGAYLRRRPLDTSRAAIDARARFTRFGTAAAVAFAGAAGSMLAIFDAHYAPVVGFVTGFFAFATLVFSPLFAPRPPGRPPASPLSRMTSLERAVHRNYQKF